MKSICVYCGSSSGTKQAYHDAAFRTGQMLAEEGIAVVYGGAKVGLMGTVADGALSAGGKVIGILPKALQEKELAHEGLSELHIVSSMHERKAMMADKSDGFIALPGGAGTLEEIFEVWTWGQLGYHRKPCGFLNIEGYYDQLISFLDHQQAEGFMKVEMRGILQNADTPEALLAKFRSYEAPSVPKWVKPEEL